MHKSARWKYTVPAKGLSAQKLCNTQLSTIYPAGNYVQILTQATLFKWQALFYR